MVVDRKMKTQIVHNVLAAVIISVAHFYCAILHKLMEDATI
jgi:ribosomal protein L11 methylase PrmA